MMVPHLARGAERMPSCVLSACPGPCLGRADRSAQQFTGAGCEAVVRQGTPALCG